MSAPVQFERVEASRLGAVCYRVLVEHEGRPLAIGWVAGHAHGVTVRPRRIERWLAYTSDGKPVTYPFSTRRAAAADLVERFQKGDGHA